MDNDIITLKQEHANSYLTAIKEIIQNNTLVLKDDIASLMNKPPLESMDSILTKLLSLAKKNNLVFDKKQLDNILLKYRKSFHSIYEWLQDYRVNQLTKFVEEIDLTKRGQVIKISKKYLSDVNKEIKKKIKLQLEESLTNILLKRIPNLLGDNNQKEKILEEMSKYMKNTYHKQILENIEIKILVKDTTLINCLKEQSDRYLFTLEHSHLLNF